MFSVSCECGKATEVSAGQAGDRLACSCGRPLLVPSLAELRRQSGADPYITNPAERVGMLIRTGKLPRSAICQECGVPAAPVRGLRVVCERRHVEEVAPRGVPIGLMFGWLGLLAQAIWPSLGGGDTRVVGNELMVDVPLRLCDGCWQPFAHASTPTLRRLLECEAACAEMLAAYPDATIEWTPTR